MDCIFRQLELQRSAKGDFDALETNVQALHIICHLVNAGAKHITE